MKKICILFLINATLFWPLTGYSQMTGGSYNIPIDSFSINDNSEITGGNYSQLDSSGYNEMSTSTGNTYNLFAGFHEELANTVSLNLGASSVSLGSLSQASVSNSSIEATISTDSITGFTLSLTEDGNLRSGANDINDVADGSVTAGSEEYGIRTSGTDGLFNSTDNAITNNLNIASNLGSISNDVTTINFKASASSATTYGSYSHIVTFTLTANP